MPAESRRDGFLVADMAQACDKVLRYTVGFNLERFLADEKTYDAVLRNLEIIGEAAKHVSENIRAKFPEVEWRKIAAFRDIVAHHYFGIDKNILWDIVSRKVPALAQQLKAISI